MTDSGRVSSDEETLTNTTEKMCFLCSVAWLHLRDRDKSTDIQEKLRELLLIRVQRN